MIVGIASSSVSPPAPTISITPSTLPTPTTGVYYSQNITASGGYLPYSWAWDGTLPTGLILETWNTGIRLRGTPVSGSYTFTIFVTDAAGYTASQSYTLSYSNVTPSFDYLIVGGGGGGGGGGSRSNPVVYMTGGGGGGGGGLRTGNTTAPAGTYNIVVGRGGNRALGFNTGGSGYASSIGGPITTISAAGGGGGAPGAGTGEWYNGVNGGCGGGGTCASSSNQGYGGTGSIGRSGGTPPLRPSDTNYAYYGGGGGGMGSAGSGSGTAGSGQSLDFTGTSVTYSRGGPGGYSVLYTSTSIASGIGTGGGGGPSAYNYTGSRYSEFGANGVVIIKYPNTYDLPASITGTYTYQNTGGYHIFSFTDAVISGTSGSITF